MARRDYYEVLGIGKSASADEIKKAFRKLAHELHPDKGGDATKFKQLRKAFEEAVRMAKPGQTIGSASRQTQHHTPRPTSGNGYDPFTDPNYDGYIFFQPSNPASEGFERHLYAKGCRICHGKGYVSKIMSPEQGYISIEDRLCLCQRIGIRP